MKSTWDLAPPPPHLVTSLLLLVALISAPLSRHFPVWIGGFFYAVLGLKLLLHQRKLPNPGSWVLGLLAMAGLLLVLTSYHSLFGRDAGSALLLVMLGLKLLELKQRRDLYVAVFLALFSVVVQFLFDQDLLISTYLVLVSFGLIGLLGQAHQANPELRLGAGLRHTGFLILAALPLALVLFLLFPRLSAPLWSLYTQDSQGISGFSDRLEPGSISQLSLSEAVAFRADFSGEPPAQEQLYWRGLVFSVSDGQSWQLEPFLPQDEGAFALERAENAKEYSITLEPHYQRWLFALEFPVNLPPEAHLSRSFQLRSRRPVNKRWRYRLRSNSGFASDWIADEERIRALQLPDNITPRMRELVTDWQSHSADPAQWVQQALRFFRQEPFFYSLSPPRTLLNPADQFLFDTRSGFCEHYATSFTLLMRIAGVPARVVTGYQGGDFNPHGGYLIVRQSDAHAWSEVWLDNQGWTRIDPTAAVAPERIQLPLDPSQLIAGAPIRFSTGQLGFLRNLAREAGLVWDTVNSGWNNWVLQYSSAKQSALLSRLGLGFLRERGLGIALVLVCGAILGIATLILLKQDRTPLDPAQRIYLGLCRRLAKRGLKRGASEGPRDFTERVARARPELAGPMREINRLYLRLRYSPGGSREELRQLRSLVRKFRMK